VRGGPLADERPPRNEYRLRAPRRPPMRECPRFLPYRSSRARSSRPAPVSRLVRRLPAPAPRPGCPARSRSRRRSAAPRRSVPRAGRFLEHLPDERRFAARVLVDRVRVRGRRYRRTPDLQERPRGRHQYLAGLDQIPQRPGWCFGNSRLQLRPVACVCELAARSSGRPRSRPARTGPAPAATIARTVSEPINPVAPYSTSLHGHGAIRTATP
jgi:hypothetical protein